MVWLPMPRQPRVMEHSDLTEARLSSPEPRGAAVWQMGLIHRTIRTTLAEVKDLVPTVRATAHRDVHLAHLDLHLTVLHHHHLGEDTHLWPLLLRRIHDEAPLIERMDADHLRIDHHVGQVREAATDWAAAAPGDQITAFLLVSAMGDFLDVLEAHLDEEERVVVPLLAQHISAQEWEDFGKAMNVGIPRRALPLLLGSVLDVASPVEARDFLADLPLPARLMWRINGRRQYSSSMNRVRFGPDPPSKGQ